MLSRETYGKSAHIPDEVRPSAQSEPIIAAAVRSLPEIGSTVTSLPVRRRLRPLLTGVLCLVGLILLVSLFFSLRHASAALAGTGFVALTDDGRFKQNLRTDGTRLYFNELQGLRQAILSLPAKGGSARQISTSFASATLQDVFPDGRHLLVSSVEEGGHEPALWIVPSQGGVPTRVGNLAGHSARVSPDENHIALVMGTNVVIANVDGSGARIVGSFASSPTNLVWTSDSREIRFVLRDSVSGPSSPWEIPVRDAASAAPRPYALSIGHDCCVDWSWTTRTPGFVYARYDRTRRLTLVARPELAPRWFSAAPEFPVGIGTVDGLAAGRTDNQLYLLISSVARGELLKFDSKRKEFQEFLPGTSPLYVSFSRDGEWMSYIDSMDGSLWRSRVDGTEPLGLTAPPVEVAFSAWSPNGKQIAFMGRQPGKPWRVFVVMKDGGAMREAFAAGSNQGAPTWSPDGKSIVYGNVSCQTGEPCGIHQIDLVTNTPEMLPGSDGLQTARWSFDGKNIAALRPQTRELLLYEFSAKRWRVLAGSVTGDNLNWAKDSQHIYVRTSQAGKPILESIRVKDGKRLAAVDLSSLHLVPGQVSDWFTLAPDGSPLFLHLLDTSEIYSLDWNNE